MLKIFSGIFVFLFILYSSFFILNSPLSAQQEFAVNFDTTYIIDAEGDAEVEQTISLTNKLSKVYASSYTLSLEGKAPENVKALEAGREIPKEITHEGNQTKIVINFPEALVGRDKTRIFELNYNVRGVATRNGKVWDITIPKLASPEQIGEYNLRLFVPVSFGNPAYISPEPTSKSISGNSQLYSFSKDFLVKAGVVGAFGEFQVFTFDLAYHFQNNETETKDMEIALPPDTAFQKVYYTNITPVPKDIYLDPDGNWMAIYTLAPGKRIDINASLVIQVFATPQEHYTRVNPKDHTFYLDSTDVWQAQDPQIKQLAQTLRTPRAIYDFVANKLNYDYSRVQEGSERLGALKALNSPDQAICTEFTDLFIALSRAAGIPSREINGFAYTQNPTLQPLSLVADVLHAWPEYWDEKEQVWRPVDPTWEDTTGGINFFDKFDLSHITFAIHGQKTSYPAPAGSYKLGGSNQKDLQGGFGQLPADLESNLSFQIARDKLFLPFFPIKNSVKVFNSGPVAIYNLPVNIISTVSSSQTIDFLPPFSFREIPFEFSVPLIPANLGDIEIEAHGTTQKYTPGYLIIYLERLALIFLALLLAVILILLPRIIPKLKNLYAKSFGSS